MVESVCQAYMCSLRKREHMALKILSEKGRPGDEHWLLTYPQPRSGLQSPWIAPHQRNLTGKWWTWRNQGRGPLPGQGYAQCLCSHCHRRLPATGLQFLPLRSKRNRTKWMASQIRFSAGLLQKRGRGCPWIGQAAWGTQRVEIRDSGI